MDLFMLLFLTCLFRSSIILVICIFFLPIFAASFFCLAIQK